VLGYRVGAWVQSGCLGTEWVLGCKVGAWVQSGCLGAKWVLEYRMCAFLAYHTILLYCMRYNKIMIISIS